MIVLIAVGIFLLQVQKRNIVTNYKGMICSFLDSPPLQKGPSKKEHIHVLLSFGPIAGRFKQRGFLQYFLQKKVSYNEGIQEYQEFLNNWHVLLYYEMKGEEEKRFKEVINREK